MWDWLEEEDKLVLSERCVSLPGLCSVWPESLAEALEPWLRLCRSRAAPVPGWEFADGEGMYGTLLKWCHWSRGCWEL